MRSVLVHLDLWAVASGIEEKPEENAPESLSAFNAKDQKALASILLCVKPTQLTHVKASITALHAWNKLKGIHQPKGPARKVMLFRRLLQLKMTENGTVSEHLNEFDNLIESLVEVDISLPEEFLVILLLSSLPRQFENFAVAIETRDNLPAYNIFKVKLLEEGARQEESEKCLNAGETLLLAKNEKKYARQSERERNSKETEQRHKNKSSNNNKKCYACGEFGHFAAQCKNKKQYKKERDNNCFQMLSAVKNNVKQNNESVWCLDSGATSHYCNARKMFKNYEQCEEKVTLPNDICVKAIGRGDIDINCGKITLKNVLHVQEIKSNFISVAKATENGMTVIFKHNTSEIRNNKNETILTAVKRDDLFLCEIKDVPNRCLSAVQSNEFMKWHNRYGHVNFNCLKDMIKKNTVRGIKIKEMPNSFECETCAKGKITVKPFPQVSENRSSELLSVIHSDVCGPINKNSYGGARFFVTFIDDFSRYVSVYFLKSKDQVFNTFKQYKSEVENQTGKMIKCLRSDNGREYVNNEFDKYLRENGIKRQLTVPYSPQQNGTAERANRTLCEMARSMIIEAGMSEQFWAEAVGTAAYIRNRTTTKILGESTPFEMWHGYRPSVGHLKIFGSKAIVLDKTVTKKFTAKGIECVMVGYSEVSKAYRLFNPTTHKIVVARDVVFFENSSERPMEDQSTFYIEAVCDDVGNSGKIEADTNNTGADDHESIDQEGVAAPLPKVGRGRPRIIRDGSRGRPRKQYNMLQSIGEYQLQVPDNDRDALNGPYGEEWLKSMQSEFNSLLKNHTWDLTELPKGQVAIGCRWVYAVKRDKEGKVTKLKSRLVAKGCSQRFGVNYYETFSPVVRYENIRLVVALAVEHGIYLHQMDVSSAYLNGDLHDEVYMRQPPHFEDRKHPGKVLKLKKSLYGLKQSGREWNTKLNAFLMQLGFKSCISDRCIYTQRSNGIYNIIVVYVDDLIVGSTSLTELERVKAEISSEFECVDGGELSHFLGMEFHRDGNLGAITISQKQYILNALTECGMMNCKEVVTPLESGCQLHCADEKCTKVNVTQYQSYIGVLMYLALSTRPDILLSVAKLAQHNCDPHSEHEKSVKHVFRYLKKTMDFKLHYQKTGKAVECFVDADWAGDTKDRKSFSGYVFVAAGCVFAWSAKKQNLVALSSTEAEYVALSNAATEVVYVRKLLTELGFPLNGPMTMYNDNQSAQCLVKNPTYHSRSKHIAIKYHHIRDMHSNEAIEVKYIPTDEMMADILTKNLCKIKHYKFSNMMGLY